MTLHDTAAGIVLGTPGYMAPEQVAGTPIDKRVDIWAFGVVFYELLAGRRAFAGPLRADVDWSALPANTPPELRMLLRHCLEPDRTKRLKDIGDAWLAPYNELPASTSSSWKAWPWIALSGLLAIALAIALWLNRQTDPPLRHLNVNLGDDVNLATGAGPPAAVVSRDGMRLAYVSIERPGLWRLYTRRLDQAVPRLLAGTEGATGPFFSPDGLWIGFFAGGRMKKVSVDGGAVVTLCNVDTRRTASATWVGVIRLSPRWEAPS